MPRSLLSAALATALLSTAAAAQTISSFQRYSVPYQALVGGTTVTQDSTGEGSVSLPFNFPFYGTSYGTAFIHRGGVVGFTRCGSGCSSPPGGIPSMSLGGGNNAILPLFAGSSGSFAGFSAGTLRQTTSSTDAVFDFSAMRWQGNTWPASSIEANFQVRVSSGGAFMMHYGPFNGNPSASFTNASVGFQDSNGTTGAATMSSGSGACTPTSQSNCCSHATASWSFCNATQVVPNELIVAGGSLTRELLVENVGMQSLTVGSSSLSFTVRGVARNLGSSDATSVSWRAFYSLDQTLDANDTQVASGTGVTVPANGTAVITGPGSLNLVPTAPFWLLLQVDSSNSVSEAFELNNVGASDDSYVPGMDLVASLVTGPSLSDMTSADALQVRFFNRGLTSAGTVEFRVTLSPDGPIAGTTVWNGTASVGPGETVVVSRSAVTPCNSTSGDFFWRLEVDPRSLLSGEVTRANNVRVGNKVNVALPDIEVAALDVLDPILGTPTRAVRLDEDASLSITVRNTGRRASGSFPVAVGITRDTTLSLVGDQLVCEFVSPSLDEGQSRSTRFNCRLPTANTVGQPYEAGLYYLGVVLNVPSTISCENGGTANNLFVLPDPIQFIPPGPDYVASSLKAPGGASAGSWIPVERSLFNAGNRPRMSEGVTPVRYRYYASVNDLVSESDVPLKLLNADGTEKDGQIGLRPGEGDVQSELVQLPPDLAPGTYRIGILVNGARTVAEQDVSNNSAVSEPLRVAASAASISTRNLPDATRGLRYNVRLGISGVSEPGRTRWSLAPGLGTLPRGLTLDENTGVISGAVASDELRGSAYFVVRADNGDQVALRALLIRVLPPSSALEIITTSLQPIPQSSTYTYDVPLAGAGGVRPYTWAIVAGPPLPNGISFEPTGRLTGRISAGVGVSSNSYTFELQDAVGNRARRTFTLRVVPATGVSLTTTELRTSYIGDAYLENIEARVEMGEVSGLQWTVLGRLPPGLNGRADGQFFVISGTPRRSGLFTFTIQVQDARGRSDILDYTLLVASDAYRVAGQLPAVLNPGQSLDVQLSVVPSRPVRYRLVAGLLPSGIALSPEGKLSGQLSADESAPEDYAFTVEAADPDGRVGLGGFLLRVARPPARQGCDAAAGAPALLLALGVLVRRRRSVLR